MAEAFVADLADWCMQKIDLSLAAEELILAWGLEEIKSRSKHLSQGWNWFTHCCLMLIV